MRVCRWAPAILFVAAACAAPPKPRPVERAASSSPPTSSNASVLTPSATGSAPRLSVAGSRSCVLQTSGALSCWGAGFYPDASYFSRPARIDVPALASFEVGPGDHQCGVTPAQQIVCWGVGYGRPWQEIKLPAGVRPRNVVTGPFQACVVSVTGDVYCWGKRGPDTILTDSASELTVVRISGVSAVEQLELGYAHACAVAAGQMHCWGSAAALAAIRAAPAPAVKQLSLYAFDTLALSADGSTHAWGSPLPPASFPPSALPLSIGTGIGFACALHIEHVKCWGKDDRGQTSSPTWDVTPPFATVPNLVAPVELGVGAWHACARESAGAVKCWGALGMLGIGVQPEDVASDRALKVVLPEGFHAVALDAQQKQACALDEQGKIACWGDRADTGAPSPAPAPALVSGFGKASSVQLGDDSICARMADQFSCRTRVPPPYALENWPLIERAKTATQFAESGTRECAIVSKRLYCWGDNFGTTLGVGRSEAFVRKPAPVLGLPGEVLEVSGVLGVSCALTRGGSVSCWGNLAPGAGSDLSQAQRMERTPRPLPVAGVGPVAHLRGACLLDRHGQVACLYEQTHRAMPIALPGRAVLLDDAWGGSAVLEDGSVWSWPARGDGPRRVEGLPGVPSALATGEDFSCALVAGAVYCWGKNEMGQLGTGRGGPGRIVPQTVELP